MDSGAKIRIKVGSMEVEYEGDPSFLKDGLESLLAKMAELSTQVPSEQETESDASNGSAAPAPQTGFTFSTSTIAAQLEPKSATELAVCALAKLQLVDGKTEARRSDILDEMKTAKSHFNKNMTSNLSNSLKTFTKAKRFHENSNDVYSLSSTERSSIEAKVANIG